MSLQILYSHTATALEWCLTGIQMWVSIGVYLVTRILIRTYRTPEQMDLFPPLINPSVVGGFLSFFLVL
jgi:hypothetical protein